jgi:hypothetical protein
MLAGQTGESLARAAEGWSVPSISPTKNWIAKWIWCEGEPVPQNFYLYCRKAFTLEEETAAAIIDVSADSRYKLFVNGQFVGRGPARCDQKWQYYDTYDLRGKLRRGKNVVAVMVHQYGVTTHNNTLGRGGFLLQGEVQGLNGRSVRLDSDESWRLLPAPPWDRESPRNGSAIMWMEIYDARQEPLGWMEPTFDDAGWQRPVILGIPPVFPWENLVARDIPFLLEEEMIPAAVVNSGVVDPAPPVARLDLEELLGTSGGQFAYFFTYIRSPVEQTVDLAIRDVRGLSTETTKIWLNGRIVPPLKTASFWTGGINNCVLDLRQGWNELLVKLGRGTTGWQWDLAVGPSKGELAPLEWNAEPENQAMSGRAWIMGPYSLDSPNRSTSLIPDASQPTSEVEKAILDRVQGTPVNIPRKMVELNFGPTKNVALVMAMERRRPQSTPQLQNIEKLMKSGEGPALIVTLKGEGAPYVTLDFGKEVSGYLRLRLNGVAGGAVDLGYCELLVDGGVDVIRDQMNHADRYIMRDGLQDWELFFWKGFRYLQLTFRNCPKPVELESVRVLFTSYPLKRRGAFECSDPLLNRIWEVGCWTLRLCMHDSTEDCPWREQGQWLGDAQVELQANYVAFGDVALGTKFFRQIAQGQDNKGALPGEYPAEISVYPKRPPIRAQLPPFMAQWASMLFDHYRYTGDSQVVSELYPHVLRVMGYLRQFQDSDGLLAKMPGFVFLDWVPELMASATDQRSESTGMNCHYYRALVDAAELAGLAGEKTQQREWVRQAEELKRAINERLWSEEQGLYAHARSDGQLSSQFAVHDSILAVYTGVAPPERISQSFKNLFDQPRPDLIQIGSPYFYYFLLRALRVAGRHQQALDATRHAYGKMIEAGATSWWEVFGGFGSRCHAWSTAPTSDLSSYVLGVQLTEPGYAAFRVEPQAADLTWAKGAIPTVRGDVAVNWKREGSSFDLTVTVPMKAQVELSVPAKSLEMTRLTSIAKPQKQLFRDGRARYWVEGPGAFRVEAQE